MKTVFISLLGLMLLLAVSACTADETEKIDANDTTAAITDDSESAKESDQYVVYYLHMNRRCMTCGKLESYSEEVVLSGFTKQLNDSSIVWRVVNFEEEGNEYYAKDYGLYSQSLILSQINESKEVRWKNLDKIWQLVRTKDQFIKYVQDETRVFMNKRDK